MLRVEKEIAVGVVHVDGRAQVPAQHLAMRLRAHDLLELLHVGREHAHRPAADGDAPLPQLPREHPRVVLRAGDGLVDEHGDAAVQIGPRVLEMIVAVPRGDHHAVHLAHQLVVPLHHRHAELLVQLFRRRAVVAVHAHKRNIAHDLPIVHGIKEPVGMRVLAAEYRHFVHTPPSFSTAPAADSARAPSRSPR